MSNDVILRIDITYKLEIPEDEYKEMVYMLGGTQALQEMVKRTVLKEVPDNMTTTINHMTVYQNEVGV